jgi:hypothetical protein
MAQKTVLVSDLSGHEIKDGNAATISIKFTDARKGTYVLDVTEAEAEELGQKGRKQARRGRKPKGGEVSSGSKPIEGVGTSVAARQSS